MPIIIGRTFFSSGARYGVLILATAALSGCIFADRRQPPAMPEFVSADGNAVPQLEGSAWQLVAIEGAMPATPADPARYRLEFLPRGELAAQIDCNRARGPWAIGAGDQLTIGSLISTRVACPAGSLYNRVIADLPKVTRYTLGEGSLSLSLADGTVYRLAPAAPR